MHQVLCEIPGYNHEKGGQTNAERQMLYHRTTMRCGRGYEIIKGKHSFCHLFNHSLIPSGQFTEPLRPARQQPVNRLDWVKDRQEAARQVCPAPSHLGIHLAPQGPSCVRVRISSPGLQVCNHLILEPLLTRIGFWKP